MQDTAKVRKLMQKMNESIPPEVIPYTNSTIRQWAEAYQYLSGVLPVDNLTTDHYTVKELVRLGDLLIRFKSIEAAQKAFEEVLKVDSNNYRAKGYLVDIYGSKKQYQKSINILEDWVKKNPKDRGAQQRLVQYRAMLKDTVKEKQ